MLMESQYWLPEKMRDFQRTKLQQLLRHAKTHVPFYRERLDVVFNSDGSVAWDRWQQLPIVLRKDLREQRSAMQSRVVPPGHGTPGSISTSGSTGVPVTITVAGITLDRAMQAWVRFFRLHGISAQSVLAEYKLYLPGGERMHVDRLENLDTRTGQHLHYINRDLDDQRKLDLLAATGASCLIDLPNHMEVLARVNLRSARRVRLQWVVGIGMGITAQQRQLFRKSFGALALSPYSSKEGSLMAFQCHKAEDRFHVNSELLFHEILDPAGKPCAPGQTGRFVITPFFNSAQPLIRYDTGDLVRAGDPCICGSCLPVLAAIEGRSDAIFRFPGKDHFLSRFDDELVQTSLAADAYQFAQTQPLLIEVRYVAAKDADAAACDKVRQHLLDVLKVNTEVSFRRLAEIPRNAGGKQQRIVCELPNA